MRWIMGLMVGLLFAQGTLAAPTPVAGKVTEVTIYRGQAQVVREVPLTGKAGPVELVVTDLPEQVVSSSLFAESPGAVDVRAVRYRNRPVGEEPREEVRQIDSQLRELGDRLEMIKQKQQLLKKQDAYLDKLDNFVAPTATTEMSKGVLDAKQLQEMATFTFEQRAKAAELAHGLSLELRQVQEEMELLKRKRMAVANGATRNVHEAVLFLEKRDDAAQTIRLTYLVNNCGWSPAYNLRAQAKGDKVTVEYNAMIQQMSGEDWAGVSLTLSTASPALSAATPGIAPLKVALHADGQNRAAPQPQMDVVRQLKSLQGRQQAFVSELQTVTSNTENVRINWKMNESANTFQLLEFNGDINLLRNINIDNAAGNNGPSISYRLTGTVSLASRRDQQMLRVVRADVDASLYYVAMPVLSTYVYREAEMVNTTGHDLLGGPISVYLDGRFVGRTEIATVARGQSFVIGFGADPQLQCSRELLEREDKVQGGNKMQMFSYRLAVSNYKDVAVPVRLYDRVPNTERDTDLRVTLADMSDKLSDDAVYARREQPRGILRWDLDVPAKAAGQTERVVKFNYTLEFDRSFVLSEPTGQAAAAQQEDFNNLQIERFYNR